MVKYKLAGVQRRPENVFQSLLFVLLIVDDLFQSSCFSLRWLSTKTADVDFFGDLFRCLTFRQSSWHKFSLCHFCIHGVTIQQVKSL